MRSDIRSDREHDLHDPLKLSLDQIGDHAPRGQGLAQAAVQGGAVDVVGRLELLLGPFQVLRRQMADRLVTEPGIGMKEVPSLPSPPSPALVFKDLGVTVGPLSLPFAPPPPVCVTPTVTPRSLKSLGFGEGDGGDAKSPSFSSSETVMVMVRVPVFGTRLNSTSIPNLRRAGAARRSRPDSARGFSGRVLARVTFSPATSPRAPSSSAAVSLHLARPVMKARTVVATKLASITLAIASSRFPQ